jgi:hypothetical protein
MKRIRQQLIPRTDGQTGTGDSWQQKKRQFSWNSYYFHAVEYHTHIQNDQQSFKIKH